MHTQFKSVKSQLHPVRLLQYMFGTNSNHLQVAKEDGTMCRVEGCGKKFVHCWQRLEHEGSVHGGKRLHCDICDKTYALSAKTSL